MTCYRIDTECRTASERYVYVHAPVLEEAVRLHEIGQSRPHGLHINNTDCGLLEDYWAGPYAAEWTIVIPCTICHSVERRRPATSWVADASRQEPVAARTGPQYDPPGWEDLI